MTVDAALGFTTFLKIRGWPLVLVCHLTAPSSFVSDVCGKPPLLLSRAKSHCVLNEGKICLKEKLYSLQTFLCEEVFLVSVSLPLFDGGRLYL